MKGLGETINNAPLLEEWGEESPGLLWLSVSVGVEIPQRPILSHEVEVSRLPHGLNMQHRALGRSGPAPGGIDRTHGFNPGGL